METYTGKKRAGNERYCLEFKDFDYEKETKTIVLKLKTNVFKTKTQKNLILLCVSLIKKIY